MKDDFERYLEKQLKNPDFKKEYEALQPENEILKAIITARSELGLTQAELSEKTGINQADISRIENGNGNPSLRTLKRLASAMGKQLEIRFV